MNKIEISEMWNLFANLYYPAEVCKDSIQYIESRKVFYAAVAQTLLKIRTELKAPDISIEQGIEILKDMDKQAFDFLKEESERFRLYKN